MSSSAPIYAAGGVLWRQSGSTLLIAVVRRAQYDDVTLPKGKVDPGETLRETAVREIWEETGIRVALGLPVGVAHYHVPSGREKVVQYWAAEVSDEDLDASVFIPNDEISAVEWITPQQALHDLSYEVDARIVKTFLRFADDGVLRTFCVILLRHAQAVARREWPSSDAERPLTEIGQRQAVANVGALAAYRVRKIFSSPAVRCVQTVTPLAQELNQDIRTWDVISQDSWESGLSDVRSRIAKRVRAAKSSVICSHGPVLPGLLREIAFATESAPGSFTDEYAALPVGGFTVVHLSATHPAFGIIALETHTSAQVFAHSAQSAE